MLVNIPSPGKYPGRLDQSLRQAHFFLFLFSSTFLPARRKVRPGTPSLGQHIQSSGSKNMFCSMRAEIAAHIASPPAFRHVPTGEEYGNGEIDKKRIWTEGNGKGNQKGSFLFHEHHIT